MQRKVAISVLLAHLAFGTACGSGDASDMSADDGRTQVAEIPPGADGDAIIIGQLRDSGADLSKPRRVNFHAYVQTQSSAVGLETNLQGAGFQAEYDESSQGDFLVTGSEIMVVTLESIGREAERFRSIVEMVGATYDGWEAAAKP